MRGPEDMDTLERVVFEEACERTRATRQACAARWAWGYGHAGWLGPCHGYHAYVDGAAGGWENAWDNSVQSSVRSAVLLYCKRYDTPTQT